jgi:hypothetical protein
MWLRFVNNLYQYIQKCVTTPHQQPDVSVTQKINSRGTELQVMNQGEETTTGVVRRPSSEEDPESPTTPTVFVRHGRVIGDQ